MGDQSSKETQQTLSCNLFNPTHGRRVIFDGIKDSMKAITIDSGATKYNVTLSKAIAEELRDRNRLNKDSDLVIGPASESPPVAA